MRGKGNAPPFQFLLLGITPAYAGKREPVFFGDGVFQDHPRLCGEKFCNNQFGSPIQGSPPPMRGKDIDFERRTHFHRITPAYAGKSVFNPVKVSS